MYCSDNSEQQVLVYAVNPNDLLYDKTYIIRNTIRNFDEMFPIIIEGNSFLLILDNDEDIDSNDKQSTVKVFRMAADRLILV